MCDMNFQNKVYIVTGSASGIGKSAAEKLLESEATVIGIDKQESSIENSRYHHYMASITDEAKIKSIVNEVVEKFGRIDGLVNAAGSIEADSTGDSWLEVRTGSASGLSAGTKQAC